MAADFSLLGTPDFASSALSGYAAGQRLGRQRQLDVALQGADLTKPETLMPILRADPATGATLLTAASEMAKAQHETAGRAALGNYVSALVGGGALGGGSSGAAPADIGQTAGTVAATSSLDPAQPASSDGSGDIVVTAHRDAPDPLTSARAALIQSDPKAFLDIQDKISLMNKAQREQLDAANSTFGGAIEAARSMPYEQRRAYIQTQRAALIAHGVPAAQIDAFDPTDANITGIENQVLGVKGILDRQDKDRSFALSQDKFAEDKRHTAVEEGQGAARIGLEGANVAISRGNLAVARGHLALDQKKDGRVASGNLTGLSTDDLLAMARRGK